MKIAVTARGQGLESTVDPRFGRCGWFILADTDTGENCAVSNDQNSSSVQGAGIQAAEIACRLGVCAVITGHCGPKAFRVLKAAGIKVFYCTEGTVGETLSKFKKGLLEEAKEADVKGHWA
ncbi:MAG: NifB/NifX family molybdenum-iron cluster-binding protein [Bacillota bacterium]